MKSVLRAEPLHHRAERRIMAHPHLCVLSYLLMRSAENRTGESWPLLRERLDRVSVGQIETDHVYESGLDLTVGTESGGVSVGRPTGRCVLLPG